MPKVHGSLPIVWDDALGPAYAAGAGAAAPSYTVDFIAETGGNANELRLPTFSETTDDRVYFTIQFPHDIYIPASGNITLKPHVHWTFNAEPTNGETVVWELNYVIAALNATFSATVTPLTATAYTTTAAAEIRKHIVTALGDITVAAANVGPSMVLVGNLKLDSSSTIAASLVGLLSFDVHYQKCPIGTDTEFA